MKIILKEPLQIDVSALAECFPTFEYRGPFEGYMGYVSSELIRDNKTKVLLFDGKTAKGFTEIRSDYDESELATLLAKIDESFSIKLTDAIKKAGVKLPVADKKIEKNTHVQSQYAEVIKKHLWRFVIDGNEQSSNDPLIFDNERMGHPGEPGYLNAMTEAMNFMLEVINTPLSVEYIIRLHDIALEKVIFKRNQKNNHKDDRKGIRTTPATFFFTPSNINLLGLVGLFRQYNSLMHFQLRLQNDSEEKTEGSIKELFEKIIKTYQCSRGDPIKDWGGTLKKYLVENLAKLITQYNKDIELAQSNTDKIIAIADFVHKADLLHPFPDGNVRTFVFIIANKLLLMNGFPPAIFEEPNRFDGFDVLSLCLDIIEGIETTHSLMNIKPFTDINFSEIKKEIQHKLEEQTKLIPDMEKEKISFRDLKI